MAIFAPPSASQGYWTPGVNVGVPGGIDQYLAGGVNDRAVTGTVINITDSPYNADPTGVANSRDAIVLAIEDVTSGGVIYFPAGTYKVDGGFIYLSNYKSNFTIRGAGPTLTTLVLSSAGTSMFITNDPGDRNNHQIVSGTKTKGTATISVPEGTGTQFPEDSLAIISYENENDNARIQAGAAPVWSSGGYPWQRSNLVRITGNTSSTVSIDPPLTADGTNLVTRISNGGLNKTKLVGFEDFSIRFSAPPNHPTSALYLSSAMQCWVYNVYFLDWTKNDNNGSCIMIGGYQNEIRKCRFRAAESGASSDGALGIGGLVSSLIVDNIFAGNFGYMIYENGGSTNNVIAYNYAGAESLSVFHNAHPSLNILEGNVGYNHQSDGYHGSSSNNTIFRNLFVGGMLDNGGEWYSLILNRFKRQYVVAGNTFGRDGVRNGKIGWGWPNFNTATDGFAGPTGLSDQVGQIARYQYGYPEGTYVIQPSDVAVGDFWEDWEITGTLTTRTSDVEGVFTVNSGNWFTGDSPTGAARLEPTIHWDNKTQRMVRGEVTSVAGNLVTIIWSGGVLPPEGTPVQMYMGAAGWQEYDLDVQASTLLAKNYISAQTGTGAIANDTADALPDSLVYSEKPSWFGDRPWPPFDPDSPSFDGTNIPAGYRFVNEAEPPPDNSVATPSFSPAAGSYSSAQSVTITCSTSGATIHYTTDGSTPTSSSPVYSSPIAISSTTTLKAIAVKDGMDDSAVRTGVFTITSLVAKGLRVLIGRRR